MSVLLYNEQLKDLEILTRFLRECSPECPFLPHCVAHSVAILSLVLVRETDDRQLSVILFFMCTYRKIYNLYYVFTFLNSMYTKELLFSTLDMMPAYMISMATPRASEQLVLYYTVILFYYIILIH